jgi:CBS domain-containing protein
MQTQDIMTRPVTTVPSDADLETVAQALLKNRVGSAVVVNVRGKAVGIVTETDLTAREPAHPFVANRRARLAGRPLAGDLRQLYFDLRRVPVHKVMQERLITLRPTDPVEKAVDLMVRHNIHHLPVVQGGRPVGMVARLDLLRLMWATGEHVVAAV